MRSVKQLMDLKGRHALVTGAAGHVGLAACETLLELGASVVVMDRLDKDCRRRAARLGPRALPMACDIRDEQVLRASVKKAVKNLRSLDILIHCAAFTGDTKMAGWAVPFPNQSSMAWEAAFKVNLTSAFIMTQEARQALSASGRGSVILMSSIYGMVGPNPSLYEGMPLNNPLAYGASKGGLLQLTKYLAAVMGPKVRVNAISPGGIERGQPKAFISRYAQRTPLKRMAVEEDIKGAVAYLAGDLSRYVTGHNLVVDGGFTAW
ncbi:MAG: short-chain dehydrogenase [Elusimicrobia bacterium RIFCSPHIGHO2_02_FULL_57_9]|nr:MAG: short-chain dehydrogenase [Elusimicrobia bacterium RIFCSPHIGHO2_02_FULL_57_9]